MPELKHHFRAGKMNKDLDERLVPNGEYRNAENIEISTSEGSDVGSVQNVIGNTKLVGKTYDKNTGVLSATGWDDVAGAIDDLTNPECIGSIVDTQNDKIYWFIATSDKSVSAIAEYEESTGVISPILVDKNNILDFTSSYKITGVNVIEGMLLWTDNQTEPKKIKISKFKSGSTDFNTHTTLTHTVSTISSHTGTSTSITLVQSDPIIQVGMTVTGTNIPADTTVSSISGTALVLSQSTSGAVTGDLTFSDAFTEDDITVVKLSPLNPPTLTMLASKRIGVGTGTNEPALVKYEFLNPSTDEILPALSSITLSFVGDEPEYTNGDILNLTHKDANDIEHEISVKIRPKNHPDGDGLITKRYDTTRKAWVVSQVGVIIQNVPTTVPEGSLQWEVVLDEEDPLFENKFVRYAYRWKYKDGEYSCYSPFSDIAFIPGNFKYQTNTGFNEAMVNHLRFLSITIPGSKPPDVEEIDILYKESNNNLVYVADTLKENSDGTFPSLTYEVKSEIIGSVVEANQLLRPWDNVPKRAKSQEITANRLIYGNYYQQYDIPKENLPEIETTILPKSITSATQVDGTAITEKGKPAKSLKSQRTYQVGVVYRDAYGRETPVFSNKNSAKLIGKSYAEKVNSLQCQLLNDAPSWATHFKYFVKETSNEYYNLALDRFYEAEDGNIWLSFPSCERNKVSEDSYITLKKKHNSQEFVSAASKYKVLDIQNEAPEFITIITKTQAVATCLIKSDSTDRPTVGTRIFEVRGPAPEFNDKFANGFTADSSIRIITTGGTTKKYKVESGGPIGEFNGGKNPKEIYRVTLQQQLTSEDAEVLANTYLEANDEIKLELFVDEKEMKPEFFGKFFVKIQRDSELNTNILTAFPALEKQWSIVDSEAIYKESQNTFEKGKWDVNGKTYKKEVQTASWIDSVTGAGSITAARHKATTPYHPTPGSNKKEFSFYYSGIDYGDAWRSKGNEESICKATNKDDTIGCERNNPPCKTATCHNGRAHNETDNVKPFLEKITTDGTVFSFTNTDGVEGVNYEVTGSTIDYQFRTKDQPVRRQTRAMRRKYTIEFKTLGGESGYSDEFNYNNATETSSGLANGRINQINLKEENIIPGEDVISTTNPAIFETEPKEGRELDIYNEISGAYPIVRPTMKVSGTGIAANTTIVTVADPNTFTISNATTSALSDSTVTLTDAKGIYHFDIQITALNGATTITVDPAQVHGQEQSLDWFNCYSFGNGVESNRFREDFNAVTIDKGPKVSTVLAEQYKEEHKLNGLIWSGIFNSRSSINRLNQFVMADPITKDLNPYYGSIQKLHGRKSDLLTFCEDQVLTIVANKDILYNADGNSQLTASNKVLGQAVPYSGEYGISKNPESFISHANNVFWADKARGAVCSLQGQSVIPISSMGMTDWFKDNLVNATSIIGTYNQNKNSYNVTIKGTNNYTLSYDSLVKGWVSFKSFIPESGLSLNNKYYTYSNGDIWIHNNQTRNNFYGVQYESGITVLLNDMPETIKGFKTINYEGTDARKYTYAGTIASTAIGNQTMDELMTNGYTEAQITPLTETAGKGWYCNSITTNEATGSIRDFKEKEGKWFNYLKGDATTLTNLDSEEFSVQGVGQFSSISGDTAIGGFDVTLTLKGSDSEGAETTLALDGTQLTGVSGGSWALDSDNDKIYWNDVTTGTNLNSLADPVLTLAPLDGYTLGTQAVTAESPADSIDGTGTWSSGNSTLTIELDSHTLAADRNITARITGGTVKTYSINGTYDTIESNTTTATSLGTAYSATAADGSSSLVINKTFTAASGYYFPIDGGEDTRPYGKVITEDADPDTYYTFTYTDTIGTMYTKGVGVGVITARQIQVHYKHGAENIIDGDKIIFYAHATKQWVEKTEVNAITGFTADKLTDIPATGDKRYIKISATVGNDAPKFQLKRTLEYYDISPPDSDGDHSGWTAADGNNPGTPKYLTLEGYDSGTGIHSGTWAKTPTTFTWTKRPSNSAFYEILESYGTLGNYPKKYEYEVIPVVPGAVATDFTGDNPITLYQYKDVTLTSYAKDDPAVAKADGTRILNYDVTFDSADGSTHKTQSTSDTISYAALAEPSDNSGKDALSVSHKITTRNTTTSTPDAILVTRDPEASDFTFQRVNGVVSSAVNGSTTVVLQEEIPAIVVGMIVTDEDEDYYPETNVYARGTETDVTVTAISGKTITLSSQQRIPALTTLTFKPPNSWEFDVTNVAITKGSIVTPIGGIGGGDPTSPLYADVTVTADYEIEKYGSLDLTSILKTNKFLSFWDTCGTGSGGGTVMITLLAATGNISSYGAMTGKLVSVGTTSGTTLSGTVVLNGNWNGNVASGITVGLMTTADGVAGFDPDSYSGDTVLTSSQFPGTGDGDDTATVNWSVDLNTNVLITTSLKLGFTVTLEETP